MKIIFFIFCILVSFNRICSMLVEKKSCLPIAILENKNDINLVDKDRVTPLVKAICAGNDNKVKSLIDERSDLNLADSKRYTPLTQALVNNYPNIVEILLKAGADS